MPFSQLDAAAISRSLAQVAEREGDVAEVFFERLEDVELPPLEGEPGLVVRREAGFAVRLLRDGLSWIAARDGFDRGFFTAALRQVARAQPQAPYPEPPLVVRGFGEPPEAPEVLELPARLNRRIRDHHVAFRYALRVSRHRRQTQVIGTRLVPAPQSELFYSCAVELPWGRYGTLLPSLDSAAVDALAATLVASFEARSAAPPAPRTPVLVLGPQATAVLLHEAVAHALETDTLIAGGSPRRVAGLELGARCLSVLDDPATAPEGVRREVDDEGVSVLRRWLLKEGVVRQPLADQFAALESSELAPGSGRRGSRTLPPVPRSWHLEIVPGGATLDELLAEADGGLYLPLAERGSLDPASGAFQLVFPWGYRITGGERGEPVGRCRLASRVSDLLHRVTAVGSELETAGAGWCAKGGQRLPVWATAAATRIEGVEISA